MVAVTSMYCGDREFDSHGSGKDARKYVYGPMSDMIVRPETDMGVTWVYQKRNQEWQYSPKLYDKL